MRCATLLATVLLVLTALPLHAAPKPSLDQMTVDDHQNLERNLRWILARERAAAAPGARKAPVARVGVVADAGTWHVSASSVVSALEADGVACRVLDATLLATGELERLEALVLPGGWATFQWAALGEQGRTAVRTFVERGGRCLGVSAGAYLLAKNVLWEGQAYSYPLGLFDGDAEGPLAGLAPQPGRAAVRVTVTADGARRGLAALGATDVLYHGGPRLLRGTGVTVLATYPDGTAAAVVRTVGLGEVVLIGPHLERPAPSAGADDAPAPRS